jgi:hypothetical protein
MKMLSRIATSPNNSSAVVLDNCHIVSGPCHDQDYIVEQNMVLQSSKKIALVLTAIVGDTRK